MKNLHERVGEAVRLFWATRESQRKNQGRKSGQKDAGLRAAVTGGKHLDGFTAICRDLFLEGGVLDAHVFWAKTRQIPGYYRPTKDWDLVVVADGQLLAVIEFKAQIGPSFGNNFNNRVEEALGNATDLWAAYREGAFRTLRVPGSGTFLFLKTVQNRNLAERWFKNRIFLYFQNSAELLMLGDTRSF